MDKRQLQQGVLWLVGLGVVIVLGAYVLVVLVTGLAPQSSRATAVCRQPASVVYGSDASYSVFAHEPTWSLSISRGRRMVSVGLDSDYGVFVDLNSATDVKSIACDWDQSGVTIVEPKIVTHFVPAEVFTRGR